MYAVILAGGGGTRLWPMSRQARPKPFLPLLGERTLLQATVERIAPIVAPEDVYVVTHRDYAAAAREQLPDVGSGNVLEEPAARNTMAAVALAATVIGRPDDDVMVVLPADHRLEDEEAFRSAVRMATAAADDGTLVTLGIAPSGPETGYGYIIARGVRSDAASGVVAVERFVEKPPLERARQLLADGGAYWNAGIFVWRRDAVLRALEKHAPSTLGPIRAALAAGGSLEAAYPSLPSISIDHALMEPASLEGRVGVVPLDAGWSDLGSWAALHDALRGGDEDGVVRLGDGFDVGSHDVLVYAHGGRPVFTVGLDGVVVVDTPDAVLVISTERAQDVKQVVDRLAADGRDDLR